MMNKVTARKREMLPPYRHESEPMGKLLLHLFYSLSAELGCNPKLYHTDGPSTLWVFYPHSIFLCDSLVNDYSVPAAVISQTLKLSFCGSTEAQETGEILLFFSDGSKLIITENKDISGRDFRQLGDLCVRLETDDPELLTDLRECLRHLDYRNDFLAIRRTRRFRDIFQGLEELNPDTYYQFIPLNGYADPAEACSSLSAEQQERLWLLLLCDGISAPEFDYVLSAFQEGRLNSLFSWELSLRMALDKAHVKISYEENNFHITRSDGSRILYDYAGGSAAEKLFLKILFPAIPSRH